jgi:chromosome partitioning protein
MVKPNTTLTEEIKISWVITMSKFLKMISDLVAFSRSVLINGVEDNNKAQKQIDALTKEVLTIAINN